MEVERDTTRAVVPRGGGGSLSDADVSKYRDAGAIANTVLYEIAKLCTVGASVAGLCARGDALMREALDSVYRSGSVYKSRDFEKGIAWPTCISINNCTGNYSPFSDESVDLNAGDVCKIKLGVHIDGMIAIVGHTVFIGAPADSPVEGPTADATCAAFMAMDVASRLVRHGAKASDVTTQMGAVSDCYKCSVVTGSTVSSVDQFIIEGQQSKFVRADDVGGSDDFDFETDQVVIVESSVSTGTGMHKPADLRHTVFRRNVNRQHQLKLQTGRKLFTCIQKENPVMAWSLPRWASSDLPESQLKMSVSEMKRNDLVFEYPVMVEQPGSIVVTQISTFLLTKTGVLQLTGNLPPPYVSSQHTLPPALAKTLQMARPKAPRTGKEAAEQHLAGVAVE